MKIVFINGSPKPGKNNSGYFISELERMIRENENSSKAEIIHVRINRSKIESADKEKILYADVLVFCFPLYADAIPSHLLTVMVEMETCFLSQQKKPIVYAAVNCGFFEGKQNHIALDIVRNWCRRAMLEWKQGIEIGGGEMQGQGIPNVLCGQGPKKSLGKMMQTFVENILHQSSGENLFANPNFPRFAFIFMGHQSWYAMAKKNSLKRKEIFYQP
jgi:multimeric flavodoxin WrbA